MEHMTTGAPGIYLYGTGEAVIDGEAQIFSYSRETVIFKLEYRKLYLKIEGDKLTVRIAGKNVSEVKGRIKSVSFVKAGELDD